MQELADKLPNIHYPDFAAVDKIVNSAKANYVASSAGTPNWRRFNNPEKLYKEAIEMLQRIGLAARFMQFEQIISLFRQTHERLYQALGKIDSDLAQCKQQEDQNQQKAEITWAAAYSTYMTE